MNHPYTIYLENNAIGTTKLEKADAAMGIVKGKIHFLNENYHYQYFKNYCLKNSIQLLLEDETLGAIATSFIPTIKVVNNKEEEVKAMGIYIEGIDDDFYEICVLGIPLTVFEKEFPEHSKPMTN